MLPEANIYKNTIRGSTTMLHRNVRILGTTMINNDVTSRMKFAPCGVTAFCHWPNI